MRRYCWLIFLFLIHPKLFVSGSSERPHLARSSSKPSRRRRQKSLLASNDNPASMSTVHERKSPQLSATKPPRGGSDVVPPTSDDDNMSTLTKLRRTVFPIYGKQETTKFLLIGSIKFFIIMALTLTRDTKDTLVVTQCGAEAIAFLKVRSITCDMLLEILLYSHSFTHSFTVDLWCLACCYCFHCTLFQNGVRLGKEDSLLLHMHSILSLFHLL